MLLELGCRSQTPISALLVNPEYFYQNAKIYASIARIASRPLAANALVIGCKCAGVGKVLGGGVFRKIKALQTCHVDNLCFLKERHLYL